MASAIGRPIRVDTPHIEGLNGKRKEKLCLCGSWPCSSLKNYGLAVTVQGSV